MSLLRLFLLCLIGTILSCQESQEFADFVVLNADIYTVDKQHPYGQAMAIKNGTIQAVGTTEEMNEWTNDETVVRDFEGAFIMPGFIEGHGHFSGLGSSLMNLNFLKSKDWDEIVGMVAEKAKQAKPGEWIIGRGWHQEKWASSPERNVHGYPYHEALSLISPDNPVMLTHASGHSLFANDAAMKLAGISAETPDPVGGLIVRDDQGEVLGVFEERAQGIIRQLFYEYQKSLSQKDIADNWIQAIDLAQEECLKKGITSFQDAGSSYAEITRYTQLAEDGKLDIRLWAMLRHSYDRMNGNLSGFPIIDAGDQFFTCRAIKSEVDGALGAFGAWLLKPYNDKPDFHGQNTTPIKEVKNISDLAMAAGMQFCVHAIGDRANRVVLDIMQSAFEQNPEQKDLRWRIEHAQHLDPVDIPRFKEFGIIASMQGIHCTSDAPFVEKRLGLERAKYGSYPWRSLLDAGALIANGTDAPVEDVDPIPSFYASVTRKRIDNGLEFFTEQSMTREEAIYSYTLGNAYAGFEEDWKGSLESGKVADFVVLNQNLHTCSDAEILQTKVLATFVNGELKFENK